MSSRLRVLVLSRSYPSSVLPGLGLWVEKPILEVSDRCDLTVISPVPWCPPLPNIGPLRQYVRFRAIPRHEVRSGIEVHRPRFLVGFGQTLYRIEASTYHAAVASTVDRLHRESPFDLIHAHFIYPDGVVARRLSERYGVPFVVSEHAPWVPWLQGPRSVREQALAAARDAAFLLPVSTSVRRTILEYTNDEHRVRVVPNGVDGSVFAPATNGAGRKRGRILFVGLIKYVKGIDVLFEAMQIVKARNADAHLVLVGGSFYRDTHLQWRELELLPKRLGIDDCVTFLGPKPVEEVARLMRESAVLVLPSRAESFGAVLVEALASGTPVVATACGGPEDVVTDEVGMLVPKEDPVAVAEGILSVLDRSNRYRPEKLREYALQRYDWRAVAERIHSVYTEAVMEEVA